MTVNKLLRHAGSFYFLLYLFAALQHGKDPRGWSDSTVWWVEVTAAVFLLGLLAVFVWQRWRARAKSLPRA